MRSQRQPRQARSRRSHSAPAPRSTAQRAENRVNSKKLVKLKPGDEKIFTYARHLGPALLQTLMLLLGDRCGGRRRRKAGAIEHILALAEADASMSPNLDGERVVADVLEKFLSYGDGEVLLMVEF